MRFLTEAWPAAGRAAAVRATPFHAKLGFPMRCLEPRQVASYAGGSLQAEEADAVRHHAESCAECRTAIARASLLHAAPGELAERTAATTPQGGPDLLELARQSISDELAKGATVGRYIIVERLGAGGMGVVYAAYDPELHRKVALKLLRAEAAPTRETSLGHARLLREAQAVAQLTHENVVTIYDVGTYQDRVFIAFELVEGTTLKGWLGERRRGFREVLSYFAAAGRGLAAAHAVGLVHRDFKPDNVLVGRDGRIRVTDFGLARRTGSTDEQEAPAGSLSSGAEASTSLDHPLTQAGVVIGTPAYMGPEQFLGKPADARTDQFSFCVALHEGLYGERPFQGRGRALVEAIKEGKVPAPPRDARVPAWLRRILLRGLQVDPSQRFPSMEALLTALADDPAVRRRKLALAVGAPLLLALAVLGSYRAASQRGELCAQAQEGIDAAWSPGVRAEVEKAFLATGAPYAAGAFSAVDQALTRHAAAWGASSLDACQAARIRGDPSDQIFALRTACLDARRVELRALTALFAAADAKVVERAVQATQALGRIDRCADASWLLARVKPPEDPEVVRQVAEVRELNARGKALIDAGKSKDALPVLAEAAQRAARVEYRTLVAEVGNRLGYAQYVASEFKAARETTHQALIDALATAQDDLAADALITLTAIENKLVQYEAAHRWAAIAYGQLDRVGPSEEEQRARLMTEHAQVLFTEGRYQEALAKGQQAVALSERSRDTRGLALGFALFMVARAHDRLGEYEAALAAFDRALQTYESQLGPDYPQVGTILTASAPVHRALGRLEEAIRVTDRAVRINERAFGASHPSTAAAQLELATALRELGRVQEALELIHRARESAARALGAEHPLVEFARRAEGASLILLDRPKEALVALALAEAINRKVRTPDHAAWTYLWVSQAEAELKLGRHGRAQELLERSLQRREQGKFGRDDLGDNRLLLARVLWEHGRERLRALELAAQAEQDYAAVGHAAKRSAAAAWLAERPSRSQR